MNLRSLVRLFSVVVLAAAVAAPALAAPRGNGGQQGARQRLRDGSCLQAQTQIQSQSQTRARSGAQDRTQTRQRLRDGSCLPAPSPVPAK